ncbi:MAG: hypothetical protein ACREWG_11615 [Gammaproteobacteria bacterium]
MERLDVVVVSRVDLAVSNARQIPAKRLVLGDPATLEEVAQVAQSLHLPLAAETGKAILAGEQFLHGAFFPDEFTLGNGPGFRSRYGTSKPR